MTSDMGHECAEEPTILNYWLGSPTFPSGTTLNLDDFASTFTRLSETEAEISVTTYPWADG